MTPILSSDSITLLIEFRQTSITPIALLYVTTILYWGNYHVLTHVFSTGWHLFGVGISGFLVVPSARVFGKRHAFLIGTILLIISNIWAGASKSYDSLLWARIIQGVGVCPFEALLGATVGDLYPVHVSSISLIYNRALANLCRFSNVVSAWP